LGKEGLLESFKKMVRASVISSYLRFAGVSKDSIKVSDKQIEKEIARRKRDDNQVQYFVLEMVFFSDPQKKRSCKDAAAQAYEELLKRPKNMPKFRNFQDVAIKFSQAASAQEQGVRGWVPVLSLDPNSAKGLKDLKVGDFSAPIQTRPGECRIYFLVDKKNPGEAPESTTVLHFSLVSVPYTPDMPAAQQKSLSIKVGNLLESKSIKDFEAVAADYHLDVCSKSHSLSECADFLRNIRPGTCSQPIFTGKSLDILFMVSSSPPKKTELVIKRENIKKELEEQKRTEAAQKFFKNYKKNVLIRWNEDNAK
jgi:hypothetical protein